MQINGVELEYNYCEVETNRKMHEARNILQMTCVSFVHQRKMRLIIFLGKALGIKCAAKRMI